MKGLFEYEEIEKIMQGIAYQGKEEWDKQLEDWVKSKLDESNREDR